ncbi:hypothetical protein PSTT_13262 [Puccinia striiformis]|uniref:Retrotransposon gag domain-containing protein n=1 Tax=Puccinia striiformis TaxID=27350 RepID=A0A2S4USE5_9BASI|nr:hypothetical protein PSTT_13262 [Puccinia striiformis]
MAGNTSRNNTASALQQQSKQENSVRLAGELFPSLAPMETDNNYLDFSQDTGVSPAQVNSHTTSLATRIAGITMSHRPNSTQERLAMDERMRSEAPRTPTPTPSVQNHWREQNGQINCFLDQGNITDLVAVFDQQFNIGLGTGSDGEPLSKDSNKPNSAQTSNDNTSTTSTDTYEPTQRTLHSATIITEPRDLLLVLVHRPQPRRGTVYQDHGLGQNQGFYPGPPPPQQQHFMSEPPRAGFQEHHQQPLPFEGDHRHKHHFKQGFQGKFREPHPPQAHQPPQHHHPYAQGAGAWRGSRRNWRNNSNPITQTMEIEPIEEPDKDNPPHMEPRPMIKEPITKKESHEHKIPQQCAPIRNLEPTNPITEDWEVTFPKLDHGPIDLDLRRKLWRGIPKTTEWEVFSGQMPYNHKLWIKQIDVYAKDYLMLDAMVVSRLTTCMSGSAKSWYISHRVGNENKTWAWWKNAIENKYGTESAKLKLREEFDASRFHLNNPKIHE